MVKNKKKKIHHKVEKNASNIVALASIIAIVILYTFPKVPPPFFVSIGLLGGALGAKWDDVAKWFRGKS